MEHYTIREQGAPIACKQFDRVYQHNSFSFMSSLLVSGMLAAMLWPMVQQKTLMLWLLSLWAVTAVHNFHARCRNRQQSATEQARWRAIYVACSAAAGVCWGGAVLILASSPQDPATMPLIIAIAGVAAFASATASNGASAAFLLSCLLPLAFWLFSYGTRTEIFMGAIVLSYLALMLKFSRQINSMMLAAATTHDKPMPAALERGKSPEYSAAERLTDRSYAELFANFEDNIFFVDVGEDGAFSIDSINPAAERSFDLCNKEVRGKRKCDLFPAELAARLESYDQACVDSGRAVNYEEVLDHPSGRRHFSITHIPIRDESGRIFRIAAISRDITDSRNMQILLQKREEEYRALCENAPDPIYRYDRKCRRLYVNPAVMRISEKSASMLLGKTPTEAALVPPAESVRVQHSIQFVLDTGMKHEVEVMFIAPDGRELYFQNINVPEFGEDGKVQSVLSIGRDITSRRRMEDILLRSEREYRTLSENSPDSIVRYDDACRIRYINKNFEALSGMPGAYMLGKKPSEIFCDGLFDALESVLEEVIRSGEPAEHYVTLPDTGCGVRYQQLRIAPERDENGKVCGALSIGRDVTESRRHELELLDRVELEQRLSTMAQNIPGFIFSIRVGVDGHTSFPFVSAGVEELFGLRPDEIREDAAVLRARYHPDDLPRIIELMEETARTLAPFRIEIRIKNRDNGQSWIEIRSMPERQPDGATEWHGIMIDITARKHLEQQLRLKEFALDHAHEAIYLIDSDLRFAYINEEACRTLGYSREELICLTPADIDPYFMHEDSRCVLETLFGQGNSTFETSHRRRDGSEFPVEIRGALIEYDGKTMQLALARDISSRKAAEAALKESEQKYHSVFESSNDGIFLHRILECGGDTEFVLHDLNQKGCELLGCTREDMLSGRFDLLALNEHPCSDADARRRNQLAAEGEPQLFDWEFKRSDGTTICTEVNLRRIQIDGEAYLLAVMRDVTERFLYEQALLARAEQEQRLSSYINSAPGFFFSLQKTSEGGMSMPFASVGIASIFGLPPEEVRHSIDQIASRYHPDDVAKILLSIETSGKNLTPCHAEFRVLNHQKGERWVEARSVPHRDEAGNTFWHGFMQDITERKAMEKMLLDSEDMLKEAQRIAHVGSWDVDIVNDVLIWSDEIFRIWEIDKAQFEATFAAFLGTVHPEDRERVALAYNEAIVNHSLYRIEHRLLFPDGRVKYILEQGEPQYDAQGNPVRFIGTSLDITERKAMEILLKKRESEFRSLAETSPDLIARFDRDCRRLYANQAMAALAGKNAEALLGAPPTDGVILAPAYAQKLVAGIHEVFAEGGRVRIDLSALQPDGSTRDFDALLVPEFGANGELETVLLLSRDITERKRMADTLALREREFRSLAESLPDNIARWDLNGRYTYVNRVHERTLGMAAADLIGRRIDDVFPDSHNEVKAAIKQVVATGQAMPFVRQPVLFENGETQIHDVNLVPELDADGNIVGVLGIGRDLTEQYQLQDALAAGERELRSLADSSPGMMGSFYARPDGSICMPYVSPNIETLFGLRREDVMQDASLLMALNHPDDAQRITESIAESARSMTPWHEQYRILHPTLGERWMESHTAPEPHPDGGVIWYGYVHDITKRKAMELELQGREREYRTLAENTPDLIYRYDRDCRRIYANSAVAKLADRPASELIGSTPADGAVLNPYQANRLTRAIGEVFASASPAMIDIISIDIEGEQRDYYTHLIPEFDDAGVVRTVLVIARDITEIRRAQASINESRNFLSSVIDSISTPIFVKDREHRWILLNDAFCNMIGHPREALIGKSDYDFFPKEQADVFWEKDELVFVSGQINVNEESITGADGNLRYIHTEKTPFDQGDGERLLVGIIMDITARIKAEEALRESSEKLGELYRLSPLGIALTDMQGRYVEFNEAFRAICGYPSDELMALDYWTLTPDEYAADEAAQLESLRKTGQYGPYEKQYRQKDGTLIPIQLNGTMITGRDGKQYIWSIVEDISARREMEACLLQREEEFRSLAQNLPDPVIRYDTDGRRRYVNRAAEDMLHARHTDLIGGMPEAATPVMLQLYRSNMNQVLATGIALEFEFTLGRLPEYQRDYLVRFVSECDRAGNITGVLAIGRDISELKNAEAALKYKFERIVELNDHLEENARMLEEQAVEFEAQAVELEASQEQIKLTEAWYRGIIHLAPDGMLVIDEMGIIRLVNSQLGQMFGYGEGELVGNAIELLLPPDMREAHVARREEFFRQGIDARPMSGALYGLRGCRRDGTEFPVDVSLARLPEMDGQVGTICATVRDITVRRRMENEILLREKEFRTLVENTPDVIVRYDRECRRVYVNPQWAEVNGIAADEVIGKTPQQMSVRIKPIAIDFENRLREVMESKMPATIDLNWQNEAGETVCFAMSMIPELDGSGCVSSVLTVARDISERRRAEEALAVREQESRTLIENSPDNISRYDRNCRRIYANPTYATMVEGGIAALIGKKPSEYPGGHNADLYEAKINEVFATGVNTEFELKWQDKLDNEICSHVRLTAERDTNGDVVSVLAVGRNITELNEHRKRIYQMAFYDSLTRLPNRALFNDRLRQMLSDAAMCNHLAGVMLLDLDRFKVVNDTLGHPAGDELLQETALRLSYCVRGYDTVARLGGDEFAILLPEIRNPDDLGRIAAKILKSFSEPYTLEGKEVFISSSIGIAVYPADAQGADELLKQSDSAMYFAKRSGRNNFRFYSSGMMDNANERLMLEGDLRRGFGRGELELYYQPKVRLMDERIVGSEALLRWKHPERGMVSPDKFISIAEECGLIVEIGEWVLRSACQVACEWNANGNFHKVAINLSARQFQSNDLIGTVGSVLTDTGCDPTWIEFEITESLLLDEVGEVLATLAAFRGMGISIAIDDFGTGYSSLSYLAKFPIDTLKIDRSFTSMITEKGHHAELVKAIISIAKCLDQQVVAEGAETLEEVEMLRDYGCNLVQGYFYGKPVSKATFEELFSSKEDR